MHAGQRQTILAAQWREGETHPTLWQGCLRVHRGVLQATCASCLCSRLVPAATLSGCTSVCAPVQKSSEHLLDAPCSTMEQCAHWWDPSAALQHKEGGGGKVHHVRLWSWGSSQGRSLHLWDMHPGGVKYLRWPQGWGVVCTAGCSFHALVGV